QVRFLGEEALIKCGSAAGPVLLSLLDDPRYDPQIAAAATVPPGNKSQGGNLTAQEMRSDIIRVLGQIRYAPAVEKLASLLVQNNNYWRDHNLSKEQIPFLHGHERLADDQSLLESLGAI